jgi:hypothetical protein
MSAGREDLLIEIGAGFSRQFTYLGPDSQPVDLSSYWAIAVCRPFEDSPDFIWQLQSPVGIVLSNQGTITLKLSESQTKALVIPPFLTHGTFPAKGTSRVRPGAYHGALASWQLKLYPPGLDPFFLLEGIVCFSHGSAASSSRPTP